MNLLIVLVVHLEKIKEGFKILCKQEIQIIFIGIIQIKLAFNMMWLMVTVKIWSQVIHNMMDIQVD